MRTDDELTELEALCAPVDGDESCDGPVTCCRKCHNNYRLRANSEPTPLCDPCAQTVVEKVPELVAEVRRMRTALAVLGPREHDDTCNGVDNATKCRCGAVGHNAKVAVALAGGGT